MTPYLAGPPPCSSRAPRSRFFVSKCVLADSPQRLGTSREEAETRMNTGVCLVQMFCLLSAETG